MNRTALSACLLIAILAGGLGWFLGQRETPAPGPLTAPAGPAAAASATYPEGVGRSSGSSFQTFPLSAAAVAGFEKKITDSGFIASPDQAFNSLLPVDAQTGEFAKVPAFRYKTNSPGSKLFLGYSPGANNFYLSTSYAGTLAQGQNFKAETDRIIAVLTK